MTAPPIDTPASLEDVLSDRDRINDMISNDLPAFQKLIRDYARATVDRDTSIDQQVRELTQLELANWLKEHGQDLKRPDLSPTAVFRRTTVGDRLYGKTAPGVAADDLFDGGFADFMAATWHRARTPEAVSKQGKLHEIRNSFGSTVPADGGFLIPERLRAELLRVSLETAIVRPRARTIPMDSLTVPFPMVDSTSNATNVHGGITGYWTEEGALLTESQARFGRIMLSAKKLTAYSEVPNELYTDSLVSLEAFINEAFPEAVAWFEDIAFMRGTGVGEPLGWMGCPATVSVSKESGQLAATILWENIVKMYSRMLPGSLGRAVWIAHIDTFPELATMALSVGTGGSAIWLQNGVPGRPMSILGQPIIFTEKAETVGTAGDINFVDLGYYLIGDRQTMSAMSSEHHRFQNDQTAIRFIERVDGRPWLQSAITPNKGSNTLSPFVQLATRA